MIPRSFRKAEPWQLLWIFLAGALLWFPQFGKAVQPLCHHDRSILCPLIEALAFSAGQGGIPGQIIAFILTLATALLLVHILNSNHLLDRATYFPAYVFVILSSFHPALITLHPVIPALLIIVFALMFIFKAYEEVSSLKMMFSASLSISLASLVYFPAFVFAILPWIALMIFRDFGWRAWVGALLGLLVPYIYIFALLYIQHDISTIREIYFFHPILPKVPDLTFSWQVYLFWAIIAIILIRSIVSVLWHLNEKVISFRKKQLVMFWFVILSQLSLLFAEGSIIPHSIMLFAPVSFYFNIFFLQSRKKRWSLDVLFILLLASILLIHFS